MRRAALLLLPLCALSSAFAQDSSRAQSSVSLALKLTSTGAQTSQSGKNSTATRSAPLEEIRLGNREILESMLADDELPTSTISGWKIIAIWANWPDANPYAGNGYRFFATRGSGANRQLVAVSPSYLSLKPVKATVGYRYTLNDEIVTGGKETFNALSEVGFGIAGHAGELTGLHTGTGRYVRPSGSETTYFVPGANKVTVHGAYEDPGEDGSGVAGGSLRFGAASLVKMENYGGGGSVTGTSSAGAVSLNAATLRLDGSLWNSGTLVVNGPHSLTLSTSFLPGTLALTGSDSTSFTFSPLPASTEALTTVLSFAKAGTLTLGTGETLELLANDTLALNTLSVAQLSPLVWTPAP